MGGGAQRLAGGGSPAARVAAAILRELIESPVSAERVAEEHPPCCCARDLGFSRAAEQARRHIGELRRAGVRGVTERCHGGRDARTRASPDPISGGWTRSWRTWSRSWW